MEDRSLNHIIKQLEAAIPLSTCQREIAIALLMKISERSAWNRPDLLKQVSGNRQSKIRLLCALVEFGAVKKSGAGKKCDSYTYSISNTLETPALFSTVPPIRIESPGAETVSDPTPPDKLIQATSTSEVFKEYQMPDGTKLQLTKEEFDRVVEVIGQLNSHANPKCARAETK